MTFVCSYIRQSGQDPPPVAVEANDAMTVSETRALVEEVAAAQVNTFGS